MRRGGGHLAVAAPSFSGLVWGGADNEWCGQCSAQPAEKGAEPFISEVGHRLAGGEWVTDLARVCQALVVFFRNTSKNMG